MVNLAIGMLPNKDCSLYKGISLTLDCGIQIGRPVDDYYSKIVRFDPKIEDNFNILHKMAIIDLKNERFIGIDVDEISIALCFTLNFFADHGYVSPISFYSATKKRALNILKRHSNHKVEVSSSASIRYALRKTTTPVEFENVFISCLNGIRKDSSINVTVDRFIQSLSRNDIQSRVVDLCICIESLLPFQTEIKFRFSLFGALLTSQDFEKRKSVFKNLGVLYDARSSIVHGSENAVKSLSKLEGSWDSLFEIARYTMIYKLSYLEQNDPKTWKDHLEAMALTGGSYKGASADVA
jgi:hypothetical protein